MIRRACTAVILMAVTASAAAAQTDNRSIDQTVERALELASTPGAVVAVVVRDSLAFLRAYGHTALRGTAPLDHDAVFRADALTELLNALAAARLAHDRTLRADAALGSLITELPPELRSVTLEQLVTHTSGMSHQLAVPGRGGADNLGAAARGLTRFDRFAPGGTVYSHSRPGMALAGLAIERAAKQPYATAMQSLLLEPLGMTSSTFDLQKVLMALTPGYHSSNTPDSPVQPAQFRRDSAVNIPLRGFNTTARDAARLVAALLSDGVISGTRVLPEGVAASLFAPRADIPFSTNRSAAGVRLTSWGGRRAAVIAGGSSGHGMTLYMLPAEQIGVLVLTNKSGAGLPTVADFILRRLLGDPPPPQRPQSVPADTSLLTKLAAQPGSYINGSELIEILVRDGRPLLKSDDLTLPIRALDDGAFGALIDNRVALRFHILERDGRTFLWLGDRALAREEPRPARR